MSESDELFEQLRHQHGESHAKRLEEARVSQLEGGKEPFDLMALEAVYDTTDARGRKDPDPAVRTAFWEYKYYVLHPNVRTIDEFAGVRRKMDLWRD